MAAVTRLILIRHGQTPWTKEKRYQGSTDIELSSEGKQSIQKLVRLVKPLAPGFLYSSSLQRAQQSAAIFSKALRIPVQTDARLNEIAFGEWEGKTAQELLKAKDKAFLQWSKGKWVTPPRGENIRVFRKRVKNFLADCLKRRAGQTVAVVSHGGVVKLILMEALNLPSKFLFSFRVDPGSLSVISFHGRNSASLECLNLKNGNC